MQGAPGGLLGACDRPLHSAYDTGLLDLDGVLYLGQEPVPHAAEAVAGARAAGMRIAFVTNNASRSVGAVAAHLHELGIPADDDDVVTSAQAAVAHLHGRIRPGSAVLVLGTLALAAEVAAAGFEPVRTADGAAAVVQGLDPTTSWSDLAEAAVALHRGVPWVAGNRDSTYPTTRGLLPGNGALVAALELATGRSPVVVGKPEPALHAVAVERTAAGSPLVVGDRLDTDVLGARRAGSASLLVLTGVTSYQELLAAPEDRRPTYVGHDLRALSAVHPPVTVDRDVAWCGDGEARRVAGSVETGGPPDLALRAACALAWSAGDGDR